MRATKIGLTFLLAIGFLTTFNTEGSKVSLAQKAVYGVQNSNPVLPVPEGTHVFVSPSFCASDGFCPSEEQTPWWALFYYYAPLNEIVVKRPFNPEKYEDVYFEQHELCHAHQHWVVNGGAPDISLSLYEWFYTPQGQSFVEQFGSDPWLWEDWQRTPGGAREDFAWTCAHWLLDQQGLYYISPARYWWAEQWLPQ